MRKRLARPATYFYPGIRTLHHPCLAKFYVYLIQISCHEIVLGSKKGYLRGISIRRLEYYFIKLVKQGLKLFEN